MEESKYKLVNLLGKDITIYHPGGTIELAAHLDPVRIHVVHGESNKDLDPVVVRTRRFAPADLPERVANTYYIVTNVVRERHPERDDLLSPGTILKHRDGYIEGCDGLVSTN